MTNNLRIEPSELEKEQSSFLYPLFLRCGDGENFRSFLNSKISSFWKSKTDFAMFGKLSKSISMKKWHDRLLQEYRRIYGRHSKVHYYRSNKRKTGAGEDCSLYALEEAYKTRRRK